MTILRRALDHAPEARRVAILPTASSDPLWASELHVAAFRRLGATLVDVVNVRTPQHAAHEAHVERIRRADLVYMTGGDQARLSAVLADTPLLAALREKLEGGGVVAGTSAGAAAMSHVMVSHGDATLRKGGVKLAQGLGLLRGAILDTHFAERGRLGRLLEAVAMHPRLVGIGLGEDTAIVVRGGDVEVVGSGSAVVVQGHEMAYTNLAEVGHDQPMDLERMIVHALTHGRSWRLPSTEPAADVGGVEAPA